MYAAHFTFFNCLYDIYIYILCFVMTLKTHSIQHALRARARLEVWLRSQRRWFMVAHTVLWFIFGCLKLLNFCVIHGICINLVIHITCARESDRPDRRVNFNEAPFYVWYSKWIMYFPLFQTFFLFLCWKTPLSMHVAACLDVDLKSVWGKKALTVESRLFFNEFRIQKG